MLLVVLLAALLLVGVLASLLSRHVTRARHLVILAATAAPYMVVVALLSLVLFLVARSEIGSIAALAMAVVALGVQVRAHIAGRGARRSGSADDVLSVMTINLYFGRGDAARVLEAARAHDVDLLAMQEITAEAVEALRALGIDEAYPYSVLAPAPQWEGVALWSRLPLRDQHTELVGQLHRVSAVVSLDPDRPDDDPTVVSLHINAPWPEPPGDWVAQLAGLREQLREHQRPVIAMGDYNATLDHAPFRALLGGGCTDAALTARAWWRPTYPAFRLLPPLVTLDHIVVSGLRSTHVTTARIPGSDHLAVIGALARQPMP